MDVSYLYVDNLFKLGFQIGTGRSMMWDVFLKWGLFVFIVTTRESTEKERIIQESVREYTLFFEAVS
jgi:hypothetical protein